MWAAQGPGPAEWDALPTVHLLPHMLPQIIPSVSTLNPQHPVVPVTLRAGGGEAGAVTPVRKPWRELSLNCALAAVGAAGSWLAPLTSTRQVAGCHS